MPLPAQCCRIAQAVVKMAATPELSLRGGQRPTWQSRSTRPDYRKAIGEIATACMRFPRRFAPRNDKLGGQCGRRSGRKYASALRDVEDAVPYNVCAVNDSATKFIVCKALTKRRYRRNRFARFIAALYELQVPSRDCHVALLLAMTRQGGAVLHQCPSAVECSPTGRSLSAATLACAVGDDARKFAGCPRGVGDAAPYNARLETFHFPFSTSHSPSNSI